MSPADAGKWAADCLRDTTDLLDQVVEREEILHRLEEAEAVLIEAETPGRTASSSTIFETRGESSRQRPVHRQSSASKGYNRLSTDRRRSESHSPLEMPVMAAPVKADSIGSMSRFHEITQDSELLGGKFELGQRIKKNEQGEWVADPSPVSEPSNPLASGSSHDSHESAVVSAENDGALSAEAPSRRSGEGVRFASTAEAGTSMVIPASGSNQQSSPEGGLPPGTAMTIPTRPSGETRTVDLERRTWAQGQVRDCRQQYRALNTEILALQQQTFSGMITGSVQIEGWIVVGRGVRYLRHIQPITGRTKEDILWENIGRRPSENIFWCKVVAIGVLLSIISL